MEQRLIFVTISYDKSFIGPHYMNKKKLFKNCKFSFHDVVSKECSLSYLLNYESYLYVLLDLGHFYIPFTNKNHASITFH
ncbi:hypothetical protein Syun_023384 [Stephania yunnanensis]|uniref:Uncharacterized protein n=1 Tax=Stephania yunnanensis TaxID=152371 RepID=A0AAP0FGM4_9MAGN